MHRTTAPPCPRRGTSPPRSGPSARPRPGEIVLAGAHGGAATTTLAVLLAPAWDMGAVGAPADGGLWPCGRPVVLAARGTVAAAGRAAAVVTELAAAGVPVAALVVTGDGLPEPAEARYRFRVLAGRVGTVVRMPFIPALRVAGSPAQVRLPRRARRALAEIRAAAGEQPPCPSTARPPQGRP